MPTLVKKYPRFQRPSRWEQSFTVDRVRLRRNLCQEDYWSFVHEFWHEVIAEAPVWNWHMRIIARELQKIAEPVFRMEPKQYNLLINVPPGSTKSTLASILYLPWLWTRMPSLRFLNGSWDGDLSMEFGTKARRVIKCKLYRETFPEIAIMPDQDTKTHFANTMKGERRATSTGASIIGRHAHIQSVDDPIDPRGARSETDMTTANQWMTETLPSRVVSKAVTPLVLTMQRLAINDPAGELLARQGGTPVRHICLPWELSEDVKPIILRNKYDEDGLLDPKRLSRKVISDVKSSGEMSEWAFAGQYEQRPVPLTGGMFNVDKFVRDMKTPNPKEFILVFRWWDKAASKEKWGAFTSGVLMGILKNPNCIPRYWVLHVFREKLESAARERMMRRISEEDAAIYGLRYKVGLEQEGGSGGKDSNLSTIYNLSGFRVISERASGDKVARAEAFCTQVNAGNVGLVEGTWNRAYMEELKHFSPTSKWKDQTDASSGAFNKLHKRRIKATAGGY